MCLGSKTETLTFVAGQGGPSATTYSRVRSPFLSVPDFDFKTVRDFVLAGKLNDLNDSLRFLQSILVVLCQCFLKPQLFLTVCGQKRKAKEVE